MTEFNTKTKKHMQKLVSVKVLIQPATSQMLKTYINDCIEMLYRNASFQVKSCNLFKTDKDREKIINANSKQLNALIKKWKNKNISDKTSPDKNNPGINTLNELSEIKLSSEKMKNISIMLDRENQIITAFDIMECMFHIILTNMNPFIINNNAIKDTDPSENQDFEDSYEATL